VEYGSGDRSNRGVHANNSTCGLCGAIRREMLPLSTLGQDKTKSLLATLYDEVWSPECGLVDHCWDSDVAQVG
jgi:hypothetical protein